MQASIIFLALVLIGTGAAFAKLLGYDWPAEPIFANDAERQRHCWTCLAWGGLLLGAVIIRMTMPDLSVALVSGAMLVLAAFFRWFFWHILFPSDHEAVQ